MSPFRMDYTNASLSEFTFSPYLSFNSQAFVFAFYTIIIISLYRFTSSLFSFLNV